MNKSKRIQLITGTTTTDKYISIQLEQNIDTLEFMSLNIDSNEIYQNFNADYGVLVGRVNANNAVGIPNAKISIFIPLSDDDAANEDIFSIYPYKSPSDKNLDGKRYNLLPRVSQLDSSGVANPKQPFGSFPIKPEIVTNVNFLNVYQKYYKYTTVTNSSGDYMLFGVPIGTQTVHMSVDITDIGKYSIKPASMVTDLGYSPNLFTNNNTQIKPKNDLGDLVNIETQEINVDIIPFWGDTVNFQIGITRQDFRIRAELVSTFIIFGSAFTDGVNSMWGQYFGSDDKGQVSEMHHIRNDIDTNISISSKRIGTISEKIYYYPTNITDEQLTAQTNDQTGTIDFTSQMLILDPSEYTTYKRNGDFVYIIKCNRHKIITDDFGNEIQVPDDSTNGIFNQFRGFVTFSYTNDAVPLNLGVDIGHGTSYPTILNATRYKFKIPQNSTPGHSFVSPSGTTVSREYPDTIQWKKQHKLFSGGTIYSIARFNGLVGNTTNIGSPDDSFKFTRKFNDGFLATDNINTMFAPDHSQIQKEMNIGLIQTNNVGSITGNSAQEMVSNITLSDGVTTFFGGNWLNLSLHFPQVGIYNGGLPVSTHLLSQYPREILSSSHYTQSFYLLHEDWSGGSDPDPKVDNGSEIIFYQSKNNTQLIAGNDLTTFENTFGFARADLHPTDFIVVPKSDIQAMNNSNINKGFTSGFTYTGRSSNGNIINIPIVLTGTDYRYAKSPNFTMIGDGGKQNLNPVSPLDSRKYFYKGFDTADCIDFIISLGLV